MVFIGNQTTCWATRLTDPFDFALEHGFNAFEWFPDKKPNAGWDETDLGSAMRTSILDRARTAGMRLSVHARWQANPLHDEALGSLALAESGQAHGSREVVERVVEGVVDIVGRHLDRQPNAVGIKLFELSLHRAGGRRPPRGQRAATF
jgi:hypothetical protein